MRNILLAVVVATSTLTAHTSSAAQNCEDINVGNATIQDFGAWSAVAKQRPECAKPLMMMGMSLVNEAQPMLMLYMPNAPRECLDDDAQIKAQRLRYLKNADRFADQALSIDPQYLMAWRIKLRVNEPTPDFQPHLPACRNTYMGNPEAFIATAQKGVRAITNPEDRFAFVKAFLKSTLVPGYFRSNTGDFQQSSQIPRFLSVTQESTLREFAIKELTALLSSLKEDKNTEVKRYINHLRNE